MARTAITLLPFHPIICLDEFKTLLKGGFDDRFFDAIRSWANEGILTWIIASAQPLETLGKAHNLTSPFFNLLATVQIGELTDREVGELLDQANPTPYRFTPTERRLLRSLGGNHPDHLQIVGWKLWHEKAHSRPIARKGLVAYLCSQPNPPARCDKRSPLHTGWKTAIALLLLVAILAATLVWRDPVWVRSLVQASWAALQTLAGTLSPYWNGVGNFGGILRLSLLTGCSCCYPLSSSYSVVWGGVWQGALAAPLTGTLALLLSANPEQWWNQFSSPAVLTELLQFPLALLIGLVGLPCGLVSRWRIRRLDKRLKTQ